MKLTTTANQIKVRSVPNLDFFVMVIISIALLVSAFTFFIPNFLRIIPNYDFSHIFKSDNIVTTISFFVVTIVGNIMPIVVIYQYFTKFNTKIELKDGQIFCNKEVIANLSEVDDILVVFHFEDDCNYVCLMVNGEKQLIPIELTVEEANQLYTEVIKLTGFKKD